MTILLRFIWTEITKTELCWRSSQCTASTSWWRMTKLTCSLTPCGMESIRLSVMERLLTSRFSPTSWNLSPSTSQTNLWGSTQMSSPIISSSDWALRCKYTSTISTSSDEKAFTTYSSKNSSVPSSLSSSSSSSTSSISPCSSKISTSIFLPLNRESLLRMALASTLCTIILEPSAQSSSSSRFSRSGCSISSLLSRSFLGINGRSLISSSQSSIWSVSTTSPNLPQTPFSLEWGNRD